MALNHSNKSMKIAESEEIRVVPAQAASAEDWRNLSASSSVETLKSSASNKFNQPLVAWPPPRRVWLPLSVAGLLTVGVAWAVVLTNNHPSVTANSPRIESAKDFVSRSDAKAREGAAAGAAGVALAGGTQPQAQAAANSQGSHAPVLTVSIQAPRVKPVERKLDAHGTVAAWDPISVGATTSGLEVKLILVDEGQMVRRGQLLATLDSEQLKAQLQSEEARLASSIATVKKSIQPNRQEDINSLAAAVSQAEANVADSEAALVQAKANAENALANTKRYQMLKNQGAVSVQEAETRETTCQVNDAVVRSCQQRVAASKAALKQSQEKLSEARSGGRREDIDIANASVNEIRGNVRRLKTQIDQTLIKAPVDGLVTRRDAHLGDISTTGKSMFSMARDNRLELKAQVPANDLPLVKAGQTVVINGAGAGAETISGKVREISPLVDSDLRLATVRIDVPLNCGLKSGMYAEGHINVGKHSALTVPSQSVVSRDEKNAVFVLHGDQVERRVVELGSRADQDIEVTGGVKPSDQVVVDGAGFLKDGDFVSVSKN
jgi:HlyD family secretion protein